MAIVVYTHDRGAGYSFIRSHQNKTKPLTPLCLIHGVFCCVSFLFGVDVLLSLFYHSVSVKLSIRSQAQDGMILLLSDSKHMDFMILRMTRGKLIMSADLGKGPATITSSVAVNDGDWHTVS